MRPAAKVRKRSSHAASAQGSIELVGSSRIRIIRASGRTRIVQISSDSTHPKLAAEFANTLADEFIDQNLEARWMMTERTGEWLSNQLGDMRIKLEYSEAKLQEYARRSGLLYTSEDSNIAAERLQQLQQALSAAQADRVAKQSIRTSHDQPFANTSGRLGRQFPPRIPDEPHGPPPAGGGATHHL